MLRNLIASLIPLFSLQCAEIDLREHEGSLYSQFGEDGILSKIFQTIEAGPKYCIELGAGDGFSESSTFLLRQQGWDCLLFDRSHHNPHYHLFKEFITQETLNGLFERYGTPNKFQLLCIDTGYNDYYFWKALREPFQPAVVMIRFNPSYAPTEDKIVKYRPYFAGDGTSYYGASILALQKLGMSKGYSLVYAESTGHYLFFIRNEIVKDRNLEFKNSDDVEKLYPFQNTSKPQYLDPKNRPLLSSNDLVQ